MDAEKLVSSLHLDIKEDSNIELALKLAQVDMYTRCLRERFRRKRVVKDYQLVAKYFANQRKEGNKRLLTKEQRFVLIFNLIMVFYIKFCFFLESLEIKCEYLVSF